MCPQINDVCVWHGLTIIAANNNASETNQDGVYQLVIVSFLCVDGPTQTEAQKYSDISKPFTHGFKINVFINTE
jgi:hypothetical protein